MCLSAVALALTTTGFANAFAPLKTTRALAIALAQPIRLIDKTSTTALSISFPGQEDKNEAAEGKRATDSQLKLSGDASEAFLFPDLGSTESLEEFVAPVSNKLDDLTGGWALSYANLEPEDETTPIGISFLATNIAYGLCGLLLTTQGNFLLGVLSEFACLASFFYHYSQLKYGHKGSRIVRVALLVDYFFALSAILVGSIQLLLSHQLPTEALYGGSFAVASLGACWIWEEGLAYIILHSLWHLFSGYTGYIIGATQ